LHIPPKEQPTHLAIKYAGQNWLVDEPTPLKNMSSSVGVITVFPTEWKNVSKHQPAIVEAIYS
jgi:hypothetical protein